MVKAAVKRFTFSCAGYSIATYVLVYICCNNVTVM